jgi:hypothetical protein
MNSPARKLRRPEQPPLTLHDRAMDNLRYIRETMERSASFTHVSGIGGVLMGSIALTASALAWGVEDRLVWLEIWMVAAFASLAVAVVMMRRKSRAEGMAMLTGAGRKFTWNVIPPLAAGAVLTLVLARAGAFEMLPGTWLLLYGTSVVTGGSYSVRPIPLMGAGFMLAGVLALLAPPSLGNLFMAVGFGGLHIAFGIVIWRKHGG